MPEPAPGPALPPLRDVIARHGLAARKSLGQHFLLDLNLTAKIARAAGDLRGRTVFEVGPGPGGLTRALLQAGAGRVVAVERDERCLAALDELAAAYPDRLRIVAEDAMTLDEAAVLDRPAAVVANLPYNISTALLLKWLDRLDLFSGFTLMFQKEVAERLCAAPRGKAYGRLSVMVQWRLAPALLFNLPARAFTPPPKVASSVVGLSPRPAPLAPADPERLSRLVAAAFGQRRKMLRASLKPVTREAESLLTEAGIPPTARAEELSVEDFCRLARLWAG